MRISKLLRIASLTYIILSFAATLIPALSRESIGPMPVSYNPMPASNFHAPLSSMSLIGLTNATPNLQDLQPVSTTTPSSASVGQSIHGNFLRFLTDTSYFPQTETSIAVDPNNENHVLGGFNDEKFLFCRFLPLDCAGSFPASATGFTTSNDGGKSVAKSDDLPNIAIGSSRLVSFGDPSVVAGVDGSFFFSSLAVGRTGGNAIMIAKSNSNLFNDTVSCATPVSSPTSNPCWRVVFVFGTFVPFGTVEDKDLLAVDRNSTSPFFGSVYVGWDHFFFTGFSASYLARCDGNLNACVMLSGGGRPPVSGSDSFAAFTTPVVDKHGNVYVAWCNYGTSRTFGPVSCKVVASPPGGNSFGAATTILSFMGAGTTLPTDTSIIGWATEQFRTNSVPSLAVDTSAVSDNLYFAIQVCVSGHYYAASSIAPDNPGNCGTSAIIFSQSSSGGLTWSPPSTVSRPAVNDQPFVTVDSVTGQVVVVYYTTQFDPFNHRIDVVASRSVDNGGHFIQTRVTTVSNEPDADPNMDDYLSAGGSGGAFAVPQYGDYFQAVARDGRLWVLFTANYAVEDGTFQADPFLMVIIIRSVANTLA